MVLMGILADGHVLLEDYPGLAKTLVARSFAQVLAIGFARVQFTPDLMPSDVTGSSIYRQSDATFEFRPGPVFTNLLLADEINRAPPKTQSALLEAMAERQVTIEGETRPLDSPFLVIATQNPIEYEGTYPLPEAQLDRFLMRLGTRLPGPRRRVGGARAAHAAHGRRHHPRARVHARRADRDAAGGRERPRRPQRRPLHGRPGDGHARPRPGAGRGQPARDAGAAQAGPLPRRPGRARLRLARRRQGDRSPGPRPPADAAARDVDPADQRRRHRPGGARRGADARPARPSSAPAP